MKIINKMLSVWKDKFVKKSPIIFELVFDVSAIVLSYTIHFYIRFQSGWFEPEIHPSIVDFLFTGIVLLFYWLIIFFFAGLYRNWYVRSPFDEFFSVIKTTFFGNFILFFFVFLESSARPRLLFLLYFVNLTFFMLLGRFIAKRIQKYLREKRIIQIPSLILGTSKDAFELLMKVKTSLSWGYCVKALVLLDKLEPQSIPNDSFGITFYTAEELDKAFEEQKPHELLISMENPNHQLILDITSKCAERGIVVKIVPDLYDVLTGLVKTFPLYSMPFIEISTLLLRPWEAFLKRAIDIVVSLIVLVGGLPIWILIALLIKLDSKGPVFYKQDRVGKNGVIFTLYKFRSMYSDAEKEGPKTTVLNDPRVTRVGYFIRKTHIDEVPQFLNVLKGEMSLVGPRPERPIFLEKYSQMVPLFKRRLVVRPGITGWNQVNSPLFEINLDLLKNRLKDDFYYIENMSLKLDVEIIMRTIYLVIKGRGQA